MEKNKTGRVFLLGMLGFEEEGSVGYVSLFSSSVVVQIKFKMIYAVKHGDDFISGRTAPGLVGSHSLPAVGACREEEAHTWTPDSILH